MSGLFWLIWLKQDVWLILFGYLAYLAKAGCLAYLALAYLALVLRNLSISLFRQPGRALEPLASERLYTSPKRKRGGPRESLQEDRRRRIERPPGVRVTPGRSRPPRSRFGLVFQTRPRLVNPKKSDTLPLRRVACRQGGGH